MAFQAIKEGRTIPGAATLQFRLNHAPSSPSKRTARASRILAALDAAMDSDANITHVPKVLHPVLLNSSTLHTIPETRAKPASWKLTSSMSSSSSSQVSSQPSVRLRSRGRPRSEQSENAQMEYAVSTLPLYSYLDYTPAPTVAYTRHEDEANELVQTLRGPLGFDMEWRFFFTKNGAVERRTAVVQLCDAWTILIVQVSEMKRFPEKVKEVIESPEIVKTGANIRNDGQKLFRDFGIPASNLVELGAFAHRADATFSQTYRRSIVALAKMVEHYTRKSLDKGKVRSSNWEAAPLSQEQITYAANDAHCAWVVYNRLLAIASEQGRSLGTTPYGNNITGTLAAPTDCTNGSGTSSSQTASNSTATRPLSYATSVDNLHPSPQHLRAYNLWHYRNMPLTEICATLRSKDNPLKESTVISYIVHALQAEPTLPFSMDCLKALVQLEAGSWARHRDWILQKESEARMR